MGKTYLDGWLERNLGGPAKLGPVTIYGFNDAAHLLISIKTKKLGYICFHPSLRFLGRLAPQALREFPWKFYISPNQTTWAATFALGPGVFLSEKLDAVRRWMMWGHNYQEEDPMKEREFFWQYVRNYSHKKETGDAECAACGKILLAEEMENSNVCNRCLVRECARMVTQRDLEREDWS